jgi:hypothetical protein
MHRTRQTATRQSSTRRFTSRGVTSRRVALAAAAVVLGLSACGDPSASSTTVARPPMIKLAAGASAESGAAADAPRSMIAWGQVTYVYEGAFPALPETAGGWSFPAGSTVDQGRIAAMAQVLGVSGDVRALPSDQGGGWMVGSSDGTGASLYVGTDGMVSWWFNPDPGVWPQWVDCGVAVEPELVDPAPDGTSDSSGGAETPPSVVPEPDGKGTDGNGATEATEPVPCPAPEPPAGVPGRDAALAQAKALFTQLGYDAGDYEFEVYADEWSANVTGFLVLDGMRSPITVSAGFGANGALTWAGGSLARPERVGDYPLVGPQRGIDRLNDEAQRWMSLGYGAAGMARSAVDDVAPTAAGGGAPANEPATDPAASPTDTVLIDPMPVAPECGPAVDCVWPEAEPVTITLTGVRTDLTMVWDLDGTVWLLPAYTFTNADGAMATVVAVDDSFVQLPEALPVPEPMPEPTPEPAPDTVVDVVIDAELAARMLVDAPEDKATVLATEQGWELRVVQRDGESLAATDDFRSNRVNVAVVDGVITAVVSIG